MNDLILREPLLQEIEDNTIEGYIQMSQSEIAMMIANAPSAQQWIPVSERLPEMDGWYQCTISVGKQQRYTMDLYFRCSNKRWIDHRRLSYYQQYELWGYGKSTVKHKISYEELDDIDRTEDVVAWTFLLEPYNCKKE